MSGAATAQKKRQRSGERAASSTDESPQLNNAIRLLLSLASQMRLIHAAAIRTVLIATDSKYVKAAKSALKSYDDQVKLRGGGQSLSPPHTYAFRALLETAAADPAVSAQLKAALDALQIPSSCDLDMSSFVKVCKVTRTFKADKSRIELAATNNGQALVELLVQQLRATGAQECSGVGPRLPLERSLAAYIYK
ncbi:unnamed protein product [Polarella glacialis]|uniref:Uncharacterized protein n=1 Tax=Polarella glacialis TaxID=89957 RepID=A0A813FGZ4_POLGL|nr:unnamed protein product [Polarella glacialis]|mmetsp:Transcript_43484/g.70475  ORF Transcript_43484/g.70475 Transcript_43484/m.70475 type:complete len:194 (+) Transcript_43484:36-617(+)|eukprot:CAMPEP_0115090102 /NCGR_PEP_ID=MMETSP0227-20121206/25181_1 /TAXON_ID=89957 /ORGANISM="Polarella glacialis, Strain CCMP 1383" /LENGTH=193 /DNA_ID=CAMNT_0002481087 /DNA_START=60 /DNA_END=641 /DNA_ORIENTATION=+